MLVVRSHFLGSKVLLAEELWTIAGHEQDADTCSDPHAAAASGSGRESSKYDLTMNVVACVGTFL